MSITSSNGRPASEATRSASVSPRRRSMTMYGLPSSSVPRSITPQMFGWPIAPAARASCWKRRIESFFAACVAWSTFTATERPKAMCSASKTVPIPPSPRTPRTRYRPPMVLPRRCPATARRDDGGADSRTASFAGGGFELRVCIALPVSGQTFCSTAWGRRQWGQRMKRWIIFASAHQSVRVGSSPEQRAAKETTRRGASRDGGSHGQDGPWQRRTPGYPRKRHAGRWHDLC